MKCPNCGADNRSSAKHCKVCGYALPTAQTSPPTQMVGSGFSPAVAPASGPNLLADDGNIFPLDQPIVVLGRDPSCQVVINDNRVSRRHAEIRQQGGNYVLNDLGSSNGTVVNGQRLVGQAMLQPGDRVDLGGFGLRFQTTPGQVSIPGPQLSSPTPAPVPAPVHQPGPAIPSKPLPISQPGTGRPPHLSGKVTYAEGPYDEEPDLEWAGAVLRLMGCLFILPLLCWTPALILPFFLYGQRSNRVPTRYWRVEGDDGLEHMVKAKGDLVKGNISLGDECDFWGSFDGGTLILHRAHNHRLRTEVMARSYAVARRNQIILGILVLSAVLCVGATFVLSETS